MASAPAPPEPRRVVIDVSLRGIAKVLGALAAVVLFVRLWPILIVVVIALILVGTLSPAAAAIERRGLRRSWALALVFFSLLAGVSLLALVTVPAMGREVMMLLDRAPQIQARLADFFDHHRLTTSLADSVRRFHFERAAVPSAGGTLEYSSSVLEVIGYAATAIVLAVYLMFGRDQARGALYAWIPRAYHLRLARIILNLETIVGGYVRGQLITSALMGLFVFGLLTACRVPDALALAVFAALTDVIPFIGGLLATTPAVLAALTRGPGTTALVLVAMVLYQEVESRVVVPRVYGKTLRLSSAAVVLALLIGGKLLGIIGALLALPIAAGIRMVVEELRVDLPGDDSDVSDVLARDARAEALYAARSAGTRPEEAAAVAVEVAEQVRKSDAKDPVTAAQEPVTDGKK
jgi:predicted PurR-regulated permease PerM